MKVGTRISLKDDSKGAISKPFHRGLYTVRLDCGTTKKCLDAEVYPEECNDFIQQQVHILAQFFHFAVDYSLITKIPDIPGTPKIGKQFVPHQDVAIEDEKHYCIIFGNYLALHRLPEDLPYAYLHETFEEIDTSKDKILHALNSDSHGTLHAQLQCKKNDSHVFVTYDGIVRAFSNQRTIYSLDMGIMYIMMEHLMFQEAFVKNVCEFVEFEHCTFAYDTKLRFIEYNKKGVKHNIVSFFAQPADYLIMTKMTFSAHRHNVFCSKCFETQTCETESPHIKVFPWNPIQFVHLQLVYAFHMLDFLTDVVKIQLDKHHGWYIYNQLCLELYDSIVSKKDQVTFWKPKVALELLMQFEPKNGYLLSEDFMRSVWESADEREAWLSNFQHLVVVYTEMMNKSEMDISFEQAEHVVRINNHFVGTFHVSPLKVQGLIYNCEVMHIHSKVETFLQKKRAPAVFFPDLLEFQKIIT